MAVSAASAREVYPAIEPYDSGFLDVGEGHSLFYEQVGNPEGKPVLYLHGGPGSGCTAAARRLFDPAHWRVILFDQRGAGRSTPAACLENNDTWRLVADCERIREHVKVDKWAMCFGGSWGSTLSLAYAETHPDRVGSLVLRGIFTLRQEELDAFFKPAGPAAQIFPEEFGKLAAFIPAEERGDLVAAYLKRMTGEDEATRMEAARIWSIYEGACTKLYQSQQLMADCGADAFALKRSSVEAWFFKNLGWLEPNQLIRDAHKIKHIPTVIVQGRYDLVCPYKTAYELHLALPEAEFVVVPDAGHGVSEPGIQTALLNATDKLRGL